MESITINTTVASDLSKVWEYWTLPKHITQWNFASPEWHCPSAKNDMTIGKEFSYRMEAKDGSMGFDYSGTYTNIVSESLITYALEDGRTVRIDFKQKGDVVDIVETFDVEDLNSLEQQRQGWQAILDTFKKYVEAN